MENRLKHKAADSKRTATQESRYRLWQTQMENNETHTLVHTGIATSEHAECLTERNINGSRQNIQYEKESQTYGNGSPKDHFSPHNTSVSIRKNATCHNGKWHFSSLSLTIMLPNSSNYIFKVFSISLIFCTVVMRVGTSGRRKTLSIKPISCSNAFTPAGLPSTKSSL
mgnify:CR=1 FL=1